MYFSLFTLAPTLTLQLLMINCCSLFLALCQCGRLKKRAGDERDLVEKEGTT